MDTIFCLVAMSLLLTKDIQHFILQTFNMCERNVKVYTIRLMLLVPSLIQSQLYVKYIIDLQ